MKGASGEVLPTISFYFTCTFLSFFLFELFAIFYGPPTAFVTLLFFMIFPLLPLRFIIVFDDVCMYVRLLVCTFVRGFWHVAEAFCKSTSGLDFLPPIADSVSYSTTWSSLSPSSNNFPNRLGWPVGYFWAEFDIYKKKIVRHQRNE